MEFLEPKFFLVVVKLKSLSLQSETGGSDDHLAKRPGLKLCVS